MTVSRKELTKAAVELKKAGVDFPKNPIFLKTEELTALLAGVDMSSLGDISDETQAILNSLQAENTEAEAEAVQEEQPTEQITTEEATQEEATQEEATQEEADYLHSREAMNKAALDMNEVMGLEPGIDITLEEPRFIKAFTKAASMATASDEFSEHTWDVLEANGLGPERPTKAKKSSKPKASKEAAKPKQAKATKAAKGGVIATIKSFLISRFGKEDNSFERSEILSILKEAIPDRDPDSMAATIRVQVPGRLQREAGYQFEKLATDKYAIVAIPE